MNKQIQSYQQLLEEKKRLESLLSIQKEIVFQDIYELKKELEPVRSFITLTGKLITRDGSNPLLNAGVGTIVDFIIKKIVLARAGWLTRLVVPFLAKNYSSHFISENKTGIIDKLFSWIGKRSANGEEKVL